MALANALTDWSRQCGRSARPLQEETCPWFAGRGRVKNDAALKKMSANIKGADDRINGYLWLK